MEASEASEAEYLLIRHRVQRHTPSWMHQRFYGSRGRIQGLSRAGLEEPSVHNRRGGVLLVHVQGHKKTLIPRPETEILLTALNALSFETKPLTIIDLCAGRCIAVTIALKVPGSVVYATDISKRL